MIDHGDGNAPDQPANRFLVLRMLGHWDRRYVIWAWLGLSYLPSAVRQDLNPEALRAVRRLRLVLFDRLVAAGEVGSAEIQPVASAVHACGEWWPMPEIGPRMVRAASGLDVPAVWGLEALRRDLRRELCDARDILDDRDKSNSLVKIVAATGDLVNELRAAIGGRYANGWPKPGVAKLDRTWRRFDAARAKSGAITVLPLFVVPATQRAP